MNNSITGLLKQYQTSRRSAGYSEETIARVIANVENFAKDMNVRRVSQFTTDAALGWGERKLLKGIERSTLYAYYNSLRSFLNFVESIGIEHVAERERIRCRAIYKRMVWLRPGDVRRIINHAADPSIATLIRLIFTTGMRISEAISVTHTHLEDDENTIYIRAKGGNMRPVFITKQLHLDLCKLSSDGGHCFVDSWGVPLDRKKAYYYIKQAMIRAGFPKAYPHSLRHSFTTDLLRKGASLSHVQRLLGHSNIAVTQRYEHLITDDIQKAHAKFLTFV